MREDCARRFDEGMRSGADAPATTQGNEHAVTVLRDGYEWQGRPYKSLSAIARAITGTQWNGPVFFGLKTQKARR